MIRDWAHLRAPEFAALDPARAVAILPTAAVEQHGPHLPVGTDLLIAEGLIGRLRAEAPADLDLLVLPVHAVGKFNEHLWAPGTLTLSAATALAAWTEIGLSVARAGLRKVAIVNSHGGNADLVSILARELRVRAGLLAVRCGWGAFGHPEGMYPPEELAFGIHGGDVETSLMLHLHPEAVDMGRAARFASSAEGGAIPPMGAAAYGWIASDLNPAGVVGDAARATAEKGEATAAHAVAGLVELLRRMRDAPLDGLAPALGPPLGPPLGLVGTPPGAPPGLPPDGP